MLDRQPPTPASSAQAEPPALAGSTALKVLAPQVLPGFVQRPQLALARLKLAGVRLIELAAPDGYGKTTQLAQWHRDAMLAGDFALWVSLDRHDDAASIVQALTYAARRLGARGHFSAALCERIVHCEDAQQALSTWLAEIARLPTSAILLLDDVDLLTAATRGSALTYLVHNAPGNLRIALGTRPSGALSSTVGFDAPALRITARELCLREEETERIVQHALDEPGGTELAIRIHTVTRGWPLGVRLALASRLRAARKEHVEVAANADIGQYFLQSVLRRLSPESMHMLVSIAHLDPIHPELCRYTLGPQAPIEELERLADESALLTRSESSRWLRLHPAARELLMAQQPTRSEQERAQVATRACQWYAERDLLAEAARQATLAGTPGLAQRLAAASLRTQLHHGRVHDVLDWYSRTSSDKLDEHPEAWAAAGWALATSDRVEAAGAVVERILSHPRASQEERHEASLILAARAAHKDDLRQLLDFTRRWPAPPTAAAPGSLVLHAVSLAHCALLHGTTDAARRHLTGLHEPLEQAAAVPLGYADLLVGLSYLWEGKAQLAYEFLQLALERAEARLDRWDRVVTMLAAVLAHACLALDKLDEARLLVALRLPILEQLSLPDPLMAGYLVLAELAEQEGRQDQAAVQLAALASLGRVRGIVRIEALALCELVRLHTRHGRRQSALHDAERLSTLTAQLPAELARPSRTWCELHDQLARASLLALATDPDELRAAERACGLAVELATGLQRGADLVRARYLRASVLERLHDPRAEAERAESDSLAAASGLHRLHAEHTPEPRDKGPRPGAQPRTPDLRALTVLTPREQDILLHLANHLSNKEIAVSLGLGEETVKWHLKNLYQKLQAGDRKSVVATARRLGLL